MTRKGKPINHAGEKQRARFSRIILFNPMIFERHFTKIRVAQSLLSDFLVAQASLQVTVRSTADSFRSRSQISIPSRTVN